MAVERPVPCKIADHQDLEELRRLLCQPGVTLQDVRTKSLQLRIKRNYLTGAWSAATTIDGLIRFTGMHWREAEAQIERWNAQREGRA